MKIPRPVYFYCVGVCALLVAPPAFGMGIVDVNVNDLNFFTQAPAEDDALNELLIFEDYNEDNLVPYASHDGWAIVDNDPGEGITWFDKVVTFQQDDLDGKWALDFRVHNTSPYCWSDYHFEFWDEAFTHRLIDFPLENWSNDIFQNSAYPGPWQGEGVLEFWSPDWQCPCETNQFVLIFDPGLVNAGQEGSFGIRQVATTVPEPVTMAGLFLGVGSLLGYVRRRRRR